jgi:hypothetical protein
MGFASLGERDIERGIGRLVTVLDAMLARMSR